MKNISILIAAAVILGGCSSFTYRAPVMNWKSANVNWHKKKDIEKVKHVRKPNRAYVFQE